MDNIFKMTIEIVEQDGEKSIRLNGEGRTSRSENREIVHVLGQALGLERWDWAMLGVMANDNLRNEAAHIFNPEPVTEEEK